MFDLFNTKEKMSHAVQKLIAPRKAFKEQTKIAFLAVFDAAHPETSVSHSVTALVRTFIACGALVSVFVGMSVYADNANVAADSTLYPLKRLTENVQLVLTPAPEKPQLQATFAARRAVEISDLSTRKPSSTIIAALNKDLDSNVDDSITAAIATDLGDGKLNAFCGKVLSAIATSSVALHERLSIHRRVLARFQTECEVSDAASTTSVTAAATTATVKVRGGAPFASSEHILHSTTTEAMTLSISASTTEAVNSGDEASTTFNVRGGGSLNVIFDANTSQDPSENPTSTIDVPSILLQEKNGHTHGE